MSREEAIKLLRKLRDTIDRNNAYGEAEEMGIQALEQESKTGQWIEEDMFDGDVAYRCSECNELFWIEDGTPKDNEYNFCPKCGKRLVEPQERSDVVTLLEKTYYDFCKCEGGEGWLKIDGKEYSTDVGYAIDGMRIFMEVFKQRLAESEDKG